MAPSRLSRRAFLRLAALSAAGAPLAACDPGAPEAAGPTAAPDPTAPAPVARAELAGGDVEVWAWQRQVSGTVEGDCAEVYLSVGAGQVAATRDGARFEALAPLAEGQNQVVAVCRRQDGSEERSAMQTYTVRLARRPQAIVRIAVEDGGIALDGSASQPDEVGAAPLVDFRWSWRDDNPAPLVPVDGQPNGQRVVVQPPTTDGEYYVALEVVDAEGRTDVGASYFVVANGQPRIPDYDTENPAWVERAVVYGVVPNKFGDPAFQAVIERLDYLQDLGVNALWFSPITRSPGGDFGYAVIDYFDVNPDFGTLDEFKQLVQQAHARGIRVLIDFVPNHSSSEHPYFEDAQDRGQESPYYAFYDRDESGAPTHYFEWDHLPNLNYDNPEVERFMTEAFSFWVRDVDVDGFRVDVAWGVKERKPDYWPRWRRELKRIKPDLLLLAEASARDPYYFDNGFDAAYDWTAQLGKWSWEIAWDSRTLLVYNLNAALTNNNQGLHPDALVFRFLNNNDTGTRFVTNHGEEMTRVAAALLLTLPGIPCVYTGDEIGAWYRPYYDTLPLRWDENKYPGLHDYYKRLVALRLEQPALHSRDWLPLEVEPRQQVLGYVRYVAADDQRPTTDAASSGSPASSLPPPASPILVLLNFSDQPLEVEAALPEPFAGLAQGGALTDLLGGEQLAADSAAPLRVPLPAWGARVLVASV